MRNGQPLSGPFPIRVALPVVVLVAGKGHAGFKGHGPQGYAVKEKENHGSGREALHFTACWLCCLGPDSLLCSEGRSQEFISVHIAVFLKISCSRTGLCSRLSVLKEVGRYARDNQ